MRAVRLFPPITVAGLGWPPPNSPSTSFTRSIDAPLRNEGDDDLDDAKQWAAIGFVRALDSYDTTRTSLLTFGKYWMRAKMELHLLVDRRAISVGSHVLVDASVVRRARREISRNGTEPTIEALIVKTRL